MKRTENYHYLSLLFALTSLADNITITRDKKGDGIQQQTDYIFESNDGKLNFKIGLYKLSKDPNPYKKEVYELATYIGQNNDFLKIQKPVTTDKELFENAAKLATAFSHWHTVKIRFSLTNDRLQEIFNRLAQPINTTYAWKQDIEQTFIPLCREYITIMTAGTLMSKKFLSLEDTTAVDIRKIINQSLFAFGFSPDYVMEMYLSGKQLPPFAEEPPSKSTQ